MTAGLLRRVGGTVGGTVGGAVAAALLLAGCSSPGATPADRTTDAAASTTGTGSPSAATTHTPVAPVTPDRPPAPADGACYRLSPDDLTRPTSDTAPVPCNRTHTTQTIYVGTLDTVVDGHALAVDSDTVQRQLATTCPRKLADHLGGSAGTRALSRFNVVWYSPTLQQSDAGADWFRCDVVAFAGTDSLYPLPTKGSLKGVLDRRGALSTYGLCGTSAPGAAGFSRVICARRHSWRAVDTIALRGGARYPGAAAVRQAGDQTCKDRARGLSGGALKFRYGWEWPTAEQWSRGQRYGFCWMPG